MQVSVSTYHTSLWHGQLAVGLALTQDDTSEVSEELFPLKVHIHKDIWEGGWQVQGYQRGSTISA